MGVDFTFRKAQVSQSEISFRVHVLVINMKSILRNRKSLIVRSTICWYQANMQSKLKSWLPPINKKKLVKSTTTIITIIRALNITIIFPLQR